MRMVYGAGGHRTLVCAIIPQHTPSSIPPPHATPTPSLSSLSPQVERARLTMMLAKMHEARGVVAEASETLQEIAIETYGSMEKREKAEFLLEQVRARSGQGYATAWYS